MRIETERLIIRQFAAEDGEALYEYLSDPRVVEFEPYEPFTHEAALAEAKRRADAPDFFAVTLRDGTLIGNLYFAECGFESYELGYVFSCKYWGCGYACESAGALLDYAFEKLGARRVIATCNPENTRSWRLMERLGFSREARLRENIYFKKTAEGRPIWQDTYIYGLLAGEHVNRS